MTTVTIPVFNLKNFIKIFLKSADYGSKKHFHVAKSKLVCCFFLNFYLNTVTKPYKFIEFNSVRTIFQRLTHDSSLVYLTTETRWLATTREFGCELAAIRHHTFPKLPYGFYFTKKTPSSVLLDYSDLATLDKIYNRMLDKYFNRTTCNGEEIRPLSLRQTEGLFIYNFIFYGLGLVILFIEVVASKTSRRKFILLIQNIFRRTNFY